MPIWSEASLGPYAWEYKLPKPVKRMKLMDDGYRNLGNPQSLPLEDSPAVENELASSVVSKGFVFQDSYLQHDDLAKLPRSMDMFRKIELDPYISLQLPSPGATAGRVLRHSASLFEDLLKKNKPMTFKFGITHDACVRWHNRGWGYKYSKDKFEKMVVVFAAANPHGPAFLEAALIDRFGGFPVAFQYFPC